MTLPELAHNEAAEVADHLQYGEVPRHPSEECTELRAALVNALRRIDTLETKVRELTPLPAV